MTNAARSWLIGVGVLLAIGLPLVYLAIVVPLSPQQQAQVSLAMIGLALVAGFSRTMRPLIIFLSCFASLRYFYWRIESTITLDSAADGTMSLLLLAAEIYGLVILFLGYFQTIDVEPRTSPPLRVSPTVDVFIPTYNEPIEVVGRTVIGALAIDYPRKTVYVLDDGRRPEIREMAEELGATYLSRPDNNHAKAGNLNVALQKTSGELIAIFDADHVPVRGFLNKTVGFFDDARVALVQTAQHFFNPDPFERNLNLVGKTPPEQHFFYHVIQPGNDFWNSAFFCGSCAVLRRSAIQEAGGFRTETVTEDAHTSMELHSRGHLSVYLPTVLAAGLSTETYRAHVRQRMRWARGMAQILRTDCPLLKRGLSLPQRLNYLNAMLHFFFGIPRIVMILAPLSFLLLGILPIRADVFAVIAYILPHIGLSMIANSIISKSFRHSFCAGVYEVSIAPYTAAVTLMALISPKKGKFNVTEKGANLDESRFDIQTCWPTLALIGLSVVGLMIAFPIRLIAYGWNGSDPAELDAILINSVWSLANMMTLIAAACVAYEQPQQRKSPRLERFYRCRIASSDGVVIGRSRDLSETGIRLNLEGRLDPPAECRVVIYGRSGEEVDLAARRVWSRTNLDGNTEAAFDFVGVPPEAHRQLVELMFSDDDSWTGHAFPNDSVVYSFWYLVASFWRATKPQRSEELR